MENYKFIITNLLMNILTRDYKRHTFRDLKIYLERFNFNYNFAKKTQF